MIGRSQLSRYILVFFVSPNAYFQVRLMSPKSTRAASKIPPMSSTAEEVAARLRESLLHDKLELEVDKIFRALVKLEGSDLHMKSGQPPIVRVGGELKPLNRPPIDNEEMVDGC